MEVVSKAMPPYEDGDPEISSTTNARRSALSEGGIGNASPPLSSTFAVLAQHADAP